MAPHVHVPKSIGSHVTKTHARALAKPSKADALGTGSTLHDWEQDLDTKLQARIFKLLHNQYFDYAMALVIMFNFVVVVVETDLVAEEAPLPSWLGSAGWLVLSVFLVELCMRLFVLRCEFFTEGWNNFDFCIVIVDALMSFLGLVFGSLFPVSALRVLRLCKLARVSKVFRVFPELREMLAGLVGSLRAIFWGSVLLLFGLVVWAVLAVQFIHPINQRVTESGYYQEIQCGRCPQAFGSVFDATLTFCQQIVAGDSWGQVSIPIIEEEPITGVFFSCVFVSIGMAVLNLILGVVVNVATSAHDKLETEIEDEALVKRMEQHGHLMKICADMDEDGGGTITQDELLTGYRTVQSFRDTLSEMDIAEEDLEVLWTVLDADKTGSVCYESFVSHCYRMKISDTQFMLAYIKFYITVIKDKLFEKMNNMEAAIEKGQEVLEVEMEKMEAEELNLETEMVKVEAEELMIVAELQNDRMQNVVGGLEKSTDKSSQAALQAITVDRKTDVDHIVQNTGRSVLSSVGNTSETNAAIDSHWQQEYKSVVEESYQQRADMLISINDIKNRLDLYFPADPVLQPKQLCNPGLPTPTQVPQEQWPIMGCCRGNRQPTIVSIPPAPMAGIGPRTPFAAALGQ